MSRSSTASPRIAYRKPSWMRRAEDVMDKLIKEREKDIPAQYDRGELKKAVLDAALGLGVLVGDGVACLKACCNVLAVNQVSLCGCLTQESTKC